MPWYKLQGTLQLLYDSLASFLVVVVYRFFAVVVFRRTSKSFGTKYRIVRTIKRKMQEKQPKYGGRDGCRTEEQEKAITIKGRC